MHPSRLRARYRHIMAFFARATASFVFWEIILPRVGMRRITRQTRSRRYTQIASRFRAMAIRMGGVMIKVGQFLSSRLDVLPVEITQELSGLQDEVPAEDFDAIRKLAETELGAPLEEKFERFEPIPLAAASLGQVHRARLQAHAADAEGFQDVVVKIQRPFIDQLINVDFSVLSPVLPTGSHPQVTPLGWAGFQQLRLHSDVPVYALGGMQPEDLNMARHMGAQGLAMIQGLWGAPSVELAMAAMLR